MSKYIIFILVFFAQNISAQKTLHIKSTPENTKSTRLWFLATQTSEYGKTNINPCSDRPDFIAQEWTWSGNTGTHKSIIQFNLTSIPKQSRIKNATLSLYAYPDSPSSSGHRTLTGSNECYLERVTEYWNPNTVCWKNQPKISKKHRVLLEASKTHDQDYLNIDVTSLVQDMVNEPDSSFGFRLTLKTAQRYRAMAFASPNHKNLQLTPELHVTYKESTNTAKPLTDKEFMSDEKPEVVVEKTDSGSENNHPDCSFELINPQDYTILEFTADDENLKINQQELQKGKYLIKIKIGDKLVVKNLVIE